MCEKINYRGRKAEVDASISRLCTQNITFNKVLDGASVYFETFSIATFARLIYKVISTCL
jgi:hypothetical protein